MIGLVHFRDYIQSCLDLYPFFVGRTIRNAPSTIPSTAAKIILKNDRTGKIWAIFLANHSCRLDKTFPGHSYLHHFNQFLPEPGFIQKSLHFHVYRPWYPTWYIDSFWSDL